MRFKRWAAPLCMWAALACQTERQPEGILTKQQMVSWMVQVYIAEAKIDALRQLPDSSYHLFLPIQDSLMRAHAIGDSVLIHSYKYYFEHSDEMEKIYDAVIDSLNLYEQRIRQRPPGRRPR